MTGEQLQRARDWFIAHRSFIEQNHLNIYDSAFKPSTQYDLNKPGVWKPGHWRWFHQSYVCSHNPYDRDNDQFENVICTICGKVMYTAEEMYGDGEY